MTVRRPWSYPRAAAAMLLATMLALAATQPFGAAGSGPPSAAAAAVPRVAAAGRLLVRVIVQGSAPGSRAAERAVSRNGGRVTRKLPLVNGVAATVPVASLPVLAGEEGVTAVTPDRRVHVQAMSPRPAGSDGGGGLQSVYPTVVRATDVWSRGYTGAGITVAIVDTGVSPTVHDLQGRIVQITDDRTGQSAPCVNLSGEPNCNDSYGHGTFVAGIIAGNGADSNGRWKGTAPGARILSVKIAGADGAADVSNVLAAIQWVVSFGQRYGIRVLNLSLGTDSAQPYTRDPLNYAVERAWDAGIAVVVSASNRGPEPRTISKPGDDPFVITVGAMDDDSSRNENDDVLPDFTSRGPTLADGIAKPDTVAPGAHIVSLRAPGSTIDINFTNYIDGYYRKGSGTSMAAGVASGVAALVLSANPTMTPDRLKYALVHTTRPTVSTDPNAVGTGLLDAYAAAFAAPPGTANQGLTRSSGLGAIAGSRGTVRTVTTDPELLGVLINGLLTAQLLLWDPVGYTTGQWNASTWYLTAWYLSRWYQLGWYSADWPGTNWRNDRYWYGDPWKGGAWYGAWE
jgi:serine protease AprX